MIESLLLGLLQGLAEFLPISSSGHLVLGKSLLGMKDVGMFFDVMLHAGTYLYFCLFRKKLIQLLGNHKKKRKLPICFLRRPRLYSPAIIGIGFKDALESLFTNQELFLLHSSPGLYCF